MDAIKNADKKFCVFYYGVIVSGLLLKFKLFPQLYSLVFKDGGRGFHAGGNPMFTGFL